MLLSIPIKYKLKNKDLTKNLLRIILKKEAFLALLLIEKKRFGFQLKNG